MKGGKAAWRESFMVGGLPCSGFPQHFEAAPALWSAEQVRDREADGSHVPRPGPYPVQAA